MQFARLKRRLLRHYLTVRTILILGLIAVAVYFAITIAVPLLRLGQFVLPIVMPHDVKLSETNGRTNILILGIGGDGHDGPDLTDSIAVVSLKSQFANKEVTLSPVLIAIPRDIYLDELQDKINSAYHQGNLKKPGAGLVLAKSVISKVTGLPIHYAVVIDFPVFKQIIDLIGGIDVNVEHTFDDYQYPLDPSQTTNCTGDENNPCWYEHIHFEKGATHMDGNTALKFARSRHAQDTEGSDFARARRQSLMIAAVKTKVFSLDTLLHPQKINDIYQTFKNHINTDIKEAEFNSFFNLGLKYKNSPIAMLPLSQDLFINPPVDERGWILLPLDGDFTQIHRIISERIASTSGQTK